MTSFSTIRSVVGAAALLSITSCGDGLVGIPSPTGRQTVTATTHDSAPPAHGKATVDLAAWDEVWGRIQANPEAVPVQAHWRVCGLKYRFRGYGQLFRCLDLLAARSGGSNFIERIYAPVLIGWMRAGAYAELGQTSEALKWAEFAWRALPQAYRDARQQIYADDAFGGAAITAGGSMWAEQGPSQMYALPAGWNNPAGLDLRPQAIVMDLAAERALFYYQTGNPDFANKALEDLNKWRNAPGFFDKVSFEDTAIMLSLSPLFAMGRYKDVVESYEQAGSRMNRLEQSNKFGRTFSNVLWLGLPSLLNKLTSPDDTRLFEVSLEDASHALLYSISLDKIGKRELSKKALDEILAVQESHDMGGIYWLILYERGQISLEEGKRQEAIEYFCEAADAIELVRNNVEFEANKIGLATRTQAVYEALVSVLADEGNWKDAFLATERAKGRALVDLLAQVREFAPPRQTGGRADVGQLLTAAATNTRDSGLTGDSRNVETRGAVVSARRELGAISPETASLVSVRTESFDAIVARIAPEETLIAYFQAGDRLYGFVVSRLGTKGFLLAADGMHSEVRDFREAIENESEASRHIGETLYNRLIRPLEHEIRGGGALTMAVSRNW